MGNAKARIGSPTAIVQTFDRAEDLNAIVSDLSEIILDANAQDLRCAAVIVRL